MKRILLSASLVNLLFTSLAWADVALPDHLIDADPQVRFLGIEKYPEYVFFFTYTNADPRSLLRWPVQVAVKGEGEITVTGGKHFGGARLLAVSRTEFDRRGNVDENTPGALVVPLLDVTSVVPRSNKRASFSEYRVSIRDGKLSADTVKASGNNETRASRPFAWCVGASAFMLSLAGLGIWFARRRWRKLDARSVSNEKPPAV